MKQKILKQVAYSDGNDQGEAVQAQTDGVRIEDGGTGKPIILRQFDFRFPPAMKGRPTREQVLTEDYKKYLNNLLWVDNLELIQEPRLVFQKKGFKIFAACQPKKGNIIPLEHLESIQPLQTILQKDYGRKRDLGKV